MALAASGSLSIKGAAGAGRSISQEVDGNETGNKSLTTLSTTASKLAPHSMVEFYGFATATVAPGPVSNVVANDNALTVTCTWDAPTTGGAVGYYIVQRSVNQALFTQVSTTTDLTYVDSDVVSGSDYRYNIIAHNSAGNSSGVQSNEITH